MFTNKYERLTVQQLIRLLETIENKETEIIAIDFYNKDCQEIEGIDLENRITTINNNDELEYIEIKQKEC